MSKTKCNANRKKETDITKDVYADRKLRDFKIQHRFDVEGLHKDLLWKLQDKTTNMCFVDGPAGSAKTYVAVLAAMEMLVEERIDKIVYIRSIAESSTKSMGALPGDLDEKFSPYAMPLLEKLNEIVPISDTKFLMDQEYIQCIPVNFVRGLTFRNAFVIIDEAQNLTFKELQTILTRFGNKSVYAVCGDVRQNDIKDSGFATVRDCFEGEVNENNGIYSYQFTEDHITRSKILKHICKQLESVDKK